MFFNRQKQAQEEVDRPSGEYYRSPEGQRQLQHPYLEGFNLGLSQAQEGKAAPVVKHPPYRSGVHHPAQIEAFERGLQEGFAEGLRFISGRQ